MSYGWVNGGKLSKSVSADRDYTFHLVNGVPMFDDHQADAFDAMAARAAGLIRSFKRVIAVCMSGINRSCLLAARTLVELGYRSDEVISLVRQASGPHALSNRHFVRGLLIDCTPTKLARRLQP